MAKNPKEKAKEIFDKMADAIQYKRRLTTTISDSNAKECALIHAEGVITELNDDPAPNSRQIIFWNKVKEELKNI